MAVDRMAISGVMGSISLACWIIVFTPQVYENWRRKSSQGLSLAFVYIWLAGDVFNVIGSLLQHVLPTMILLAVYYTLADVVLLYQCLAYGDKNPLFTEVQDAAGNLVDDAESQPLLGGRKSTVQRLMSNPVIKNTLIVMIVILCGIIGYALGDNMESSKPDEPQPFSFWGQVNGWICALLYLASRVPQLLLNYKRKSTDGVAVLFFIFTLLGNITYCLSIFAADSSMHAIKVNASWILGAFGSLLLDLAVLIQFWVYRR